MPSRITPRGRKTPFFQLYNIIVNMEYYILYKPVNKHSKEDNGMAKYQQIGEITEEHKDSVIEYLSEFTDDPEHVTNVIFETLGLEEQ